MEIIETSDRKDWFDVGLQTYMSGELQYSTQTVKFTSDWNGLDLIKGGGSFTVSDMCPYFEYLQEELLLNYLSVIWGALQKFISYGA